ncbi:cytochrome c oxidase subunit II [Frigidibacter sp. ROC022]|uniref:cytochrome c oxidase subunit II n=1 Tax=Frigidibacter sp. ROC022 TaxID=2971796 RepID=UPI00215B39BB|nr:cytochrome c oxidase subunit II [Frigidibacter sp. ROC022]MCR8723988.1 cytochrome c oxidase subunit II [Frigidibacter sp. ROC022]
MVMWAGLGLAQDALGALETIGKPTDGGMYFQPAATELASDIHWLDGMINWIIGGIVALVVVLLAIVILRYNRRANPTPARFTHNTPVELAWTLLPIMILVVIGAFSLPILFKQQEIPVGDITIKVTGNQWFWNYDYVDEGFAFDSYMIGQPATIDDAAEPDVKPYVLTDAMKAKLVAAGYTEDEFLLATDNPVVVPVGKVIVMQVTAADVIHSWALPAFGVKQDGVPGRIAHLWFKPEREGVFFGQCSELCGKDHAYMPITVKVVSEEAYADWLAGAKQEFASLDAGDQPVRLASN